MASESKKGIDTDSGWRYIKIILVADASTYLEPSNVPADHIAGAAVVGEFDVSSTTTVMFEGIQPPWAVLNPVSSSSAERWTDTTSGTWTVCDDLLAAGSGPEPIQAIILGTASVSVEVRWWLSSDQDCDTGNSWVVGTRTPLIGSNVPYAVLPTQWDFRGVPAGAYTLCAEIDPDDLISESTTADDNDLTSEQTLTVQDCP